MSSNKRLRLSEPSSGASASSSSFQKRFKYDVFISFRGEDTRKTFVGHLYQALEAKCIETYKDDEKIEKGQKIDDQLLKTIQESRFFIIVFSKTYASSSWCLNELVKIIECQKKIPEQTAYPVFYDVEPTQVRKQNGPVGEAFSKHENREAAEKWRDAMKELADLAGWELKATANGDESKSIQIIVDAIFKKLHSTNSSFDGKLVGMETRISDVLSSLEIGTEDVRMIGIKGMGGGGKTTLARAVYDRISTMFEGKSFVENVREVSKPTLSGLKKLQKRILKDLLNKQDINISSVHDGRDMLIATMCRRKILVVLDDVDCIEQLEALAGESNWFKLGSRIIITTRDEQVLLAHGVKLVHDVNLLSHEEAVCLFSRYAFQEEIPIRGYEKLSRQVVQYADGLPLTIKVLGSFLCGQSEPYWTDALERLKTIPLKATMERLEISFDNLEDDYKEIFLDVACILKGEPREYAIRVLESRGFHARNGLRVLKQKSLITIAESGSLWMHDQLEEMGKNIVRRLYKHSRLWITDEVEDILTNDLGTQATQCLYFRPLDLIAEIAMKGLANMKDLRFIDIRIRRFNHHHLNWKFDKVSQYLPNSLQFVRWIGFPFSSLPNTFQGKYLVELELYGSNIVQLWEDGEEKVFHKLRFLALTSSKLRTFHLGNTPNLEILKLNCCDGLVEVQMPAGSLKLKYLNLSYSKLTNLHHVNTPNLRELRLEGCNDLVEFQMPAENLNLNYLYLTHSKLKTVHLGNTPNLKVLTLEGCNDLVELQMPNESLNLVLVNLSHTKLKTLHLGSTPKLKELKLKGCHDLVEFQLPSESLKLEYLDLSHSKLKTVHLGNTPNLKALRLKGCNDLVEFQMPAESLNLENLNLSHSKLQTIHLRNTPNLEKLILKGCCDLVELLMPAESLKLAVLNLSHSKLTNLHLVNTPNLKVLRLEGCNDLVEFQMPAESLNLNYLYLSHSKLKTIHLGNTPNLKALRLEGCNDLIELQMPAESLKLKYVNLSHSKLKTIHLGNTPNLEKLKLKGCNDLVEFQMPAECLKLEYVYLSHSKLKTIHLGNTPNLKKLILKGCNDLVEFQMPAECSELEYLDLSHSKLQTIHLWNTPNLQKLILIDCHDLVELQMPAESPKLTLLDIRHSKLTNFHLRNTPNLERLRLIDCHDSVEFQMPTESLNLEYLNLSHSKLKIVHLGNTPNLKALRLEGCYDLVELEMPDERLNLEYLDLSHSKLKTVHLRNTPNLVTLFLIGCNDLIELQMPAESLKLKYVNLSHSKLKTIHLGNTPNLEKLELKGFNDLVEFQMPTECSKLKYLYLCHIKLQTIHLRNTPNLETLILKGCSDLLELQMPAESLKLAVVNLSHSKLTNLHLRNTPNLERLILIDCHDLVELQMPSESPKLIGFYLSHSKLRTLDLGLTPNLKWLDLENCYDLVEINAPVGCLRNLAFLDISGCGRFKSFWFDRLLDSCEVDYLSELHMIAETIDVCLLHPDNSFPKFRFECYYKEDPASSFGNLEMLISMGLCACTNLENFSRSICSLRGLRKLTLEGSITEAPRDLDQLECLEELIFSSTKIGDLPESICKLKHLKSLELKSCLLLKKLPDDLGRIESLETLTITDCYRLRDIPNNIGKINCVISPKVYKRYTHGKYKQQR